MAKIKTIGNKKEILKKRAETSQRETCITEFAAKSERQFNDWFKKHFSSLPEDARTGLETLARTVWANTKVTKKQGEF